MEEKGDRARAGLCYDLAAVSIDFSLCTLRYIVHVLFTWENSVCVVWDLHEEASTSKRLGAVYIERDQKVVTD